MSRIHPCYVERRQARNLRCVSVIDDTAASMAIDTNALSVAIAMPQRSPIVVSEF
jgi:hypothetical protein